MALTQNELKRAVAQAAVAYVKEGEILGVGTGSTVDFFIDAIAPMRDRIPACVFLVGTLDEKARRPGVQGSRHE